MTCHKYRVTANLFCSVAALLMFLSSSAAAQTTTPSSLTVLHFTDGSDDLPGRMTIDAAGNSYIAAASAKGSGLFEVLKYNSQNKLTVIRYKNQPGESAGRAQAIKVDAVGNIYAVGVTNIGGRVVSFTPAGVQRWSDRFNGTPVAVAVDAMGNVYAAGTRVIGKFETDWAITKYSSSGKILWEKLHAGTLPVDVRLTDMQLDSFGNPVLLGTTNILALSSGTMTTLKLDPQGNTLWVQDFVADPHARNAPSALALDRADSVYATGATGPFSALGFTVKYDLNGNRQFALTGKEAGGASIAIDPSGDLLLQGDVTVSAFPQVVSSVVSKYHANGVKVWATRVAASGKVLSDASGNVFVAGSLANSNSKFLEPADYFVSKLSPAGKLLFGATFRQGEDVSDAAFDASGNLLVTGDVLNSIGNHEIVTLKLAKGFTPASAQ